LGNCCRTKASWLTGTCRHCTWMLPLGPRMSSSRVDSPASAPYTGRFRWPRARGRPLTIRPSRRRLAARLNSGVRPTVKVLTQPTFLVILALTGCASVRAPALDGVAWSGRDGPRLVAQLRSTSDQLPEGWLFKAPQGDASGTYDYSERGYFATDPKWRSETTYVGLLKADAVFCVVNPEMQANVTDNTITTYQVYDYCVQLHRQ